MTPVFRHDHEPQERKYTHRFRSWAGTRYASAPSYGNFALWLSLMRHYGLPTRLLDWTRSPLIGAYFALQDYIYDADVPIESAALWVIQAHDFNKHLCGEDVTPAIEAE